MAITLNTTANTPITDPNAAKATTDDPSQVGKGANGAGGPVPDPGLFQVAAYGALMKSMMSLMPKISNDDSSVKLVEATTLMKQIVESSEKDKISIDQEKKRTAIGEKTSKLEEASKKIEESRRMRESGSIWDKIKLAFQALAALLMIVIGAVLSVIPGFQAVGGLMIAAGVLSVIMMVDAAVKMSTGLGIAGNFAKLAQPDNPEAWAKADMGFGISLAIVGLAAAVATFFVPGGQASAIATMAQAVSTIANGVITGATAVGDIASGAIRYEATKKESEAKELQAEGKQFEALLSQLDDFIDQALQRLMAATDRFNAMLDALTDAIQDTGNSVSRARFSA